jgi:hypothetical protein
MIINNITNIKKKNKYLLSQIIEHTHKKKIKSVFCLMMFNVALQLPMQSVSITTDVVSSNFDQGEVYNIMW